MPADPKPLTITAVSGAVLVGHPRAASLVAITPQAALLSADQLMAAAKMALELPAIDDELEEEL